MGITNTLKLKPYPPFPLGAAWVPSPQRQCSSPRDLASTDAWGHTSGFHHHPPQSLPLSFVGSLAFHSGNQGLLGIRCKKPRLSPKVSIESPWQMMGRSLMSYLFFDLVITSFGCPWQLLRDLHP